MISNQDVAQRKSEIYHLVSSDNLPEAVKRLIDFIRDFSMNEELLIDTILISRELYDLKKAEMIGQIDWSYANSYKGRIAMRILKLVDQTIGSLSKNL